MALALDKSEEPALTEKTDNWDADVDTQLLVNPVAESAEFAYKKTDCVQVNDDAVKVVANHIYNRMRAESYTARTWRTHPLHICPPEPYDPSDPLTEVFFNWMFLISSLNFSFWSPRESEADQYAVQWSESWYSDDTAAWSGYWSLVAALNRALEDDIPIIDPSFYSSETLCPDSLIEHIFRRSPQSSEAIPLLGERISTMREVGSILCTSFDGSFKSFVEEFHRKHDGQGTALDLVRMVTDTFPSFRDEVWLEGHRVFLWKRAQILVAEIWAAFYPEDKLSSPTTASTHPIFPGPLGPAIHQLTMFADYRVPQILHHLRVLTYPPTLVRMLREGATIEPGSREEVSIRVASIVAVERVKEEMRKISGESGESISSVLIDFYLWDSAKGLEEGKNVGGGIETEDILPFHRTRSIWY